MLTPSSHFTGAKDVFSGAIHTGGALLGCLNRSKTALGMMNANLKIMIEVREFTFTIGLDHIYDCINLLFFQEANFLDRESGGLPAQFQTPEGLYDALVHVMSDSHNRTGSFHECAEVLADMLTHLDDKLMNYKKVMNGKCYIAFL